MADGQSPLSSPLGDDFILPRAFFAPSPQLWDLEIGTWDCMSIFTTAVHARHITLEPGQLSNPPIVTGPGWSQEKMEDLDAALADERAGYIYSRDAAPTLEAFEAAMTAPGGGAGAAAFSSGMVALLTAGAKPDAAIVAASGHYANRRTSSIH